MSGDQLSGDQMSGDQLSGDQLSGNQSWGDHLSEDQLSGDELPQCQPSASFFDFPFNPLSICQTFLASHFHTDWLSRLGLGKQVGLHPLTITYPAHNHRPVKKSTSAGPALGSLEVQQRFQKSLFIQRNGYRKCKTDYERFSIRVNERI